MNEDSKRDIQRLAGHYNDYQGLRIIPLGLFFGFAALGRWEAIPWGDFIYGDSDTFSMVLAGFLITLYLLISFSYKRAYGTVSPNAPPFKTRVFFILFWVAFIAAVFSFQKLKPPVNTVMLVMSVGICYESFNGSRRWGRLFLGAAVGVFAIVPMFTGSPDANYFTLFNSTMSIGFIAVGIQEHLSLRKLITSVHHSLSSSE